MKRAIFLSIILITVLWPATISAQSILEKRADLLYENLSYSKAASIYESLYKRYPENGKLIQRLAYCYDKMLNYKKAMLYYSYLVQTEERKPEDYYQYAQLLRINGNIDESKIWLEKYIELTPADQRAVNQYNQLNQLIALKDKIKKADRKSVV